ncbi:MAG TPA: argininosuccinate synthase [Elusimicrobia bacterium]|nr:argininosuccinate synthase [Elusimicrobiota bacterium]HBT61105.1 argininosuccinate synthase [Elusimicrobiota bacterium]
MKKPRIVLAFSGGLDTTFCLVWLQKEKNADVFTVTVDTGGFTPDEAGLIAAHARRLGSAQHRTIDGRDEVFSRFIVPLIWGNVLRGRVYPLSVAAERVLQAQLVARVAKGIGADAVAHGSTGAGNDQVRFDAAFGVEAPGLPIMTPVRDLAWSRERETQYLAGHGVTVPAKTSTYSVNAGLWGTTVGGKETHDPWTEVPAAAYPSTGKDAAARPMDIVIGFEKGVPVSVDDRPYKGVAVVEKLHALGRLYGLGRGVHIGDTVLGIKGRIGFEAPAPLMLIAAHLELEKLVLTRWQSFWKNHLAEFYGQMLHEGLFFDPALRDIEALMASSQETVTGQARVRLEPGCFAVTGVRSPHSLMAAQAAAYGETTGLWSGADAAGFARLHALPMTLAQLARPAAKPAAAP